MRKIIIFGNSGSGKSTLAKKLVGEYGLAHLDLDTLAWLPLAPPTRKSIAESKMQIELFVQSNKSWVVEGCYTDLLELTLSYANEMIFMHLPVSDCIDNAKKRPWEPHKYPSRAAQDENLAMLIEWIQQYNLHTDVYSECAHQSLYERYKGKKRRITRNL